MAEKHTRDFYGGDGQDIWNSYYNKTGRKFLWTISSSNWAVTFPKKRKLIQFTEGDIDISSYSSQKEYNKALTKHLNWLKKNNKSAYVEMKEDFYDDYMKTKNQNVKEMI